MYIMMVEWLDVSLNSIGKFRASEIFKTKESESMAGEKKYNYIYTRNKSVAFSIKSKFDIQERTFLSQRGLIPRG